MRIVEVINGCKPCAKCKQVLPLENFHQRSNSRTGRVSNLANCMKQDASRDELYAFAAGVMLLHQEGKL